MIDENRCNGCGYCENKCPVTGVAAIVVEPQGEIRLAKGSYRKRARELGLFHHAGNGVRDDFILEGPGGAVPVDTNSPHGEEDNLDRSLPPGFTEE